MIIITTATMLRNEPNLNSLRGIQEREFFIISAVDIVTWNLIVIDNSKDDDVDKLSIK